MLGDAAPSPEAFQLQRTSPCVGDVAAMGDDDEVVGLTAFNGETKTNDFQPWWSVQRPASKGFRLKEDLYRDFLEDDDMKSLETICKQWKGGLDASELELLAALGGHIESHVLREELAASSGHVKGFLAYRRRLGDRRQAERAMFGSASAKPRQDFPQAIPENQQNSSPESSEAETPPLSPRRASLMSLASGSSRMPAQATPPSPSPSGGPRLLRQRHRTKSSGEGLPAGISSVMDGAMNMLLSLPEEMKMSKPTPRGARHSVIAVGRLSGSRRPLVQAGSAISAGAGPSGRPASSGQSQAAQGTESPQSTSVRLLPHVNG